MKQWIKNVGKPKPQKAIREYRSQFKKFPLHIVDVGSTGGLHDRWYGLQEFCKFYTFDPDPRDQPNTERSIHFPVGLWSSHGEKVLHLTEFPSASSLYPLHPNLQAFVNAPCHRVTEKTSVKVDSLERVLKGRPSPHFIKVDAEGSDLEILKGAEFFLKTSCFGVQIEAPLIPRHEQAPLYGEISAYLEGLGFQLFDLCTERWIRTNCVHGVGAKAQTVWVDAVFFLSSEEFFKRIDPLSSEEKAISILHFVLLLIAYHLYDYATEILQTSEQKAAFPSDDAEKLTLKIKKLMPSLPLYLLTSFSLLALGGCVAVGLIPFSRLRRKAFSFLAYQWKDLLSTLLSLQRTGPYRCAVYF